MKLNVLYEDNHIIVVEKPAGVPTQADSSCDTDMYNLVKEYIKEKYNKPGDVFIGIVHRLDRPVGGVMVFARTSKGASRLSEQIRNHTFEKTYFAMVRGCPLENTGILEDYLVKDEKNNIVSVSTKDDRDAKLAILSYEVIKKIGDTALVKIDLKTGRAHQIRVQFANIGCPLIGDAKYGNKSGRSDIMLWAYKIKFKHPTKNEIMSFQSKPDWLTE